MIRRAHFILFVDDQAASRAFFEAVLAIPPRLDVPGMTELELPGGAILGLMPASGATRVLGRALGSGGPRGELYLVVDEPAVYHARAIAGGAEELSALAPRDWGHEAAYSITPDDHVLAFARELRDATR